MKVAIGHSEDIDSAGAVDEVLDACAASLGDVVPQAGLLYAAIDHDFQLILDRIMARYPDLELIGCTTDGELSSTLGFAEDSLALMLFHSDAVHFRAGIGQNLREAPETACQQAVAMASAGLEDAVRLCIANPAGLAVDSYAMVQPLSEALGRNVPICGGLAADQMRLKKTYQFYKSSVYTDAIPVLLFAGPLCLSAAVGSGWTPVDEEVHQVTRAEGIVIHTIDDKPACDFYTEYFGSADFSGNHGLAVYSTRQDAEEKGDNFYISGPLYFHEDGSLTVTVRIASGAYMRLALAKRDQLLAGTRFTIAKACDGYAGEQPDAALIFSCAGRHQLLGTRVVEEAQLLHEQFGESLPLIGFYTFGEFCPLPNGNPQSHGGTFVTVLIGES